MAFEVELTPTPFTAGSRPDVIARRLLGLAARGAGVFERREPPAPDQDREGERAISQASPNSWHR